MHRAWCCLEYVPYCFSRSFLKFQGHKAKQIVDLDPNWAFPDCNSSLNSPVAMKWCTKLEVAYERCPVVSEGHPLTLNVMQDKKSPLLTRIERFRTVTLVWIYQLLCNAARSLIRYRRGALLFLMVIHLMSRSRWTKNRQFWPELSVSGL